MKTGFLVLLFAVGLASARKADDVQCENRFITPELNSFTTYEVEAGRLITSVEVVADEEDEIDVLAVCPSLFSYTPYEVTVRLGCDAFFKVCTKTDRKCVEEDVEPGTYSVGDFGFGMKRIFRSVEVSATAEGSDCTDAFSYSPTELTVGEGCSGSFTLCTKRAGVTCVTETLSSDGEVFKTFDMEQPVVSIKHSGRTKENCRIKKEFGYIGNYVFVSAKCSGEFDICLSTDDSTKPREEACGLLWLENRTGMEEATVDNFLVTSVDWEYAMCPMEWEGHYGFNQSTVWVDKECHGGFTVCFKLNDQ